MTTEPSTTDANPTEVEVYVDLGPTTDDSATPDTTGDETQPDTAQGTPDAPAAGEPALPGTLRVPAAPVDMLSFTLAARTVQSLTQTLVQCAEELSSDRAGLVQYRRQLNHLVGVATAAAPGFAPALDRGLVTLDDDQHGSVGELMASYVAVAEWVNWSFGLMQQGSPASQPPSGSAATGDGPRPQQQAAAQTMTGAPAAPSAAAGGYL